MKLLRTIGTLFKRETIRHQNGAPKRIFSAPPVAEPEAEPPNPPDRESLLTLVNSFPYWYQRIYLGRGVYTLPTLQLHNYVWQAVKTMLPNGFQGASVLDVGTNAGYFCIQAKLEGAGRVMGVDFDDRYLKQAETCRAIWQLNIDYRQADIDRLQLHTLGQRFDVIMFTGILYHLKNPLGVLEQVASLCNDAIVVETEVISPNHKNIVYVRQGPSGRTVVTPCTSGFMKFIEKDELNSDGSNWWVPDEACVLGMLRTAGFQHFSQPLYLGETRMLVIATQQPQSIFRIA